MSSPLAYPHIVASCQPSNSFCHVMTSRRVIMLASLIHKIVDKRGFDRGYTLCVNRKKLKREVSAILRSIVSKDFQNNYGWGLQDGYNTGKHYVKRELISEKQKEEEMNQKISEIQGQVASLQEALDNCKSQ